ncbi:MAG: DUF1674 domain-containing protein [Geminicoccaceae bacterium]|nr:DUF1674 domain-containing protein [Geminicoccaceae bacterium]
MSDDATRPEPVSERHEAPPEAPPEAPKESASQPPSQPEGEKGGPKGPEPTRFGDWEKNGRAFDF